MITIQHRQEQLSRAYVHAVTARAGHIFLPADLDYGIDGSLRQVKDRNGRRFESGYAIDIQLKATTNWSADNGHIVYDLEAKTYNDLIDRFNEQRATQMLLVVLCLPADENEWLNVSQDQLILKNCCYWCKLDGQPTDNAQTKRVRIPSANILSPDVVAALLDRVARGEVIA